MISLAFLTPTAVEARPFTGLSLKKVRPPITYCDNLVTLTLFQKHIVYYRKVYYYLVAIILCGTEYLTIAVYNLCKENNS